MKNLSLKFMILAIVTAAQIGCKGSKKSEQGGFDGGGGGNVFQSKPEDVEAAIEKAKAELTQQAGLHLFRRALVRITAETDARIEIMLKQMIEPRDAKGSVLFDAPEKYLAKTKFDVRRTGVCHGPAHSGDRDGSVDKLEFGASMCLSVERLQRLPKEALFDHILALVVHEIAHINGYNETEAQLIQQFFLDNINAILARDGREVRESYFTLIEQARMVFIALEQQVSKLQDYNAEKCARCEVRLGKLNGILESLSMSFPEPNKAGGVAIAKPKLADNIRHSIAKAQAMIEALEPKLGGAVTRDDIQTEMYGLKTVLNQLRLNLADYLFGAPREFDFSKVRLEK